MNMNKKMQKTKIWIVKETKIKFEEKNLLRSIEVCNHHLLNNSRLILHSILM